MSLITQQRHEKTKSEQKFRNYPPDYRQSPSLWTSFVIVTVLVNYFIASLSYIFWRSEIDERIFYIILILDGVYLLDYITAVMKFFWTKLKFTWNKQSTRSRLVLIIDFFLVFPYSYIYEAFSYGSYNYYTFLCLRGVLALRLFHLVLLFKEKWLTAGINHIKYFFIQQLTCLLILVHTAACIWYLSALQNSTSKWTKADEFRGKYQLTSERCVISYYYALTSITNRNFGDIAPGTTVQKILMVVLMCLGFILTTGIFIGTLSFLLDITDKRKTTLKVELRNVLTFLKSISVQTVNQDIIKDYYKILWNKKIGVYQSSQFALLPHPLKYEISVDINIGFLQNSTLFHDRPDAFLRMVSNLIKREFYQTGELIYHRNVAKNKMIFVVLGAIEILSNEDDESPILALNPGSCLGETALVLTAPAKSSVRVASYTELEVLYQKDFFTLIDFFPKHYGSIRDTIMQRIANAEMEEEAHEDKIALNHFFQKLDTSAIKVLKSKLRETSVKPKENQISLYELKKRLETQENTPCLSDKFPWILHPNSSLRQFWEFCVVIVVLYISITYPFFIIFQRNYPTWFMFSYNFIDLFLVIDIVIILTTAIEEKDKIIKRFTEISQKRVTEFGFCLDFFSSVKIELFYWIWTRNQRFNHVLRLNRLLKIYRIPKLIRKREDKIEFNCYLLTILKYVFYIVLSAYWFGAFFYLITCFEDLCTEDGWYFTKVMNDLKQQFTISYTSHEILTSAYFALSCLTGLTPGEILPTNPTDMLIVSSAITCGIFAFSCCVAKSSAFLTRKLKIRTDFQDDLHSILKFMKERNMKRDLIRRVKKYFVLQWYYDKASVLKNRPLFFNTKENIHTEVQIDEKMETMMSVPLFQRQTSNFLLLLATRSRTLILPPNEYVTYKGEIPKNLYIIQAGYCMRQFEKSYLVLSPKSFFGTMSLFSNVNSLCTVKTLTHVKLLCISEDSFWKSASLYPTVVTHFKEASNNFDLLTEFKEIPINPTLSNIIDLTDDSLLVEGSLVNVIAYCKQYGENYSAPFRELGILCWLQMVMLPICILPYGSYLKLWIVIRLVVALTTTILTPYYIIQTPYVHALDKILFTTDLIAYADLYIMMFVGYYDDKKQLVVHPLKTATHYIKGTFVLDFIVCFPWEIFFSYFHQTIQDKPEPQNLLHNLHNVARIIRMGQIYRLWQIFNHVTYIRKKINSNILQVLKYSPMTLVFIHFWATILIANSCKYYSENDLSKSVYNSSFVKPEGLAYHPLQALTMYCNEDSWIDKSKFRSFTEPYQVYILSVYFSTGILTLCGLGDVTPQYLSTLIIVLVMITCGILFIGYVYAKIASHKAHWYSLLFKNQEMVTELKTFMVQENVHQKLQHQIIERVEYGWKRNKGVEPNKILTKLHPALYEDTVHAMFEGTLKNVPIFENVDKVFLRVFGKIIKEKCYLRQEMIYKTDDVVSELCIIERGVVKLTSTSRHMETFMETGGLFGNITPNATHKLSVTVKALSNVDILCMDSQAFYAAMERYPSIKRTIERNLTRQTDFIVPSFRSSEDIAIDTNLYPETTASMNTFTSLAEFKSNVLGFFSICLPWKLFRVTITEYSVVFILFDIYCLVLTHLSSIFVTYEFAFQRHTFFLLCFAIYVDITFIAKIVLEMHKAYENHYGEMVTSNSKIISRYFQNHMLKRTVDFAINFPFYYIVFLAAVFAEFDTYLIFSSLRMITLFRLLYFLDYYRRQASQLMANRLLLKIGATVVWGTLVIHFFACGWYLCACPLHSCFSDSWVNKLFNTTNVDNSKMLEVYVTCVYFTATLLTKTGTGDIVANSIQEQIYISLVMISAIFLIGIFIGEIWNFLNSTTVSRVKYDYKINELKRYLRNNKISDFQMKKMWLYVRQLWSFSKGNQMPRALSHLHSATLQELMSEIYGHHLKNSYIFSDLEEPFIRQMCQYLRRTIFFPGNYIVQHGDFDSTMYFIHYGEVDILSVHPNLTETVHEVLRRGDMFGVIQGLYYNVPHHFSFRARTTVHVMGLRFADWEHLLDFFPESKESIYTKTNKVNV